MVRLTDTQARSLLAHLLILKAQGMTESHNLMRDFQVARRIHPEMVDEATFDLLLGRDEFEGDFLVNDAITLLKDRLHNAQHDGQADLFDDLLSALKRWGGNNSLSGDVLQRIRRSVLSSEECRKIVDALQQKVFCAECGHEFKTNKAEMTTLYREPNGEPMFYCARCVPPTYIACSNHGCKGHSEIPDKLMSSIRSGIQCAACRGEVRTESVAESRANLKKKLNFQLRNMTNVAAPPSLNEVWATDVARAYDRLLNDDSPFASIEAGQPVEREP